MVNEHRLKNHLRRVHSPALEILSIGQQNLKTVEEARERYLATRVKCSSCSREVEIKNIKSHFGSFHGSPASHDMLALIGLSQPVNMFKTNKEREHYWREKMGVISEASEDLFDRAKVLNGGAYGLGKSRKH